MSKRIVLAIPVVALVFALIGCGGGTGAASSPSATPPPPTTAPAPQTGSIASVNHVVIMLQENRSFDSYFGKLNDFRPDRLMAFLRQVSPTAELLATNRAASAWRISLPTGRKIITR